MNFHPFRYFWPALTIACMFALLSGCAFEPGEPWGFVDSSISLDDEHLDIPAGVTIDSVQLTVHAIRLYSPGSFGGGNDKPFDPANPPPGYSLCHGGHCHAADGSLPSYAEVEAATSGQNSTLDLAATALFNEKLTSSHEFSGELKILKQVTLTSAEVDVSVLRIHGSVQRANKSHPLTIDVPLHSVRLTSPVRLVVGRDHPHHQNLSLILELPHDLLETIDFDELSVQSDGSISISAKNNTAQAAAIAETFEHGSEIFAEDDDDHDEHHGHDH